MFTTFLQMFYFTCNHSLTLVLSLIIVRNVILFIHFIASSVITFKLLYSAFVRINIYSYDLY